MTRKTGTLGGIIAFILAFIAEIPIIPEANLVLNLRVLVINQVEIYFWGFINMNQTVSSGIIAGAPESYVAIGIWMIILLVGMNSVMASTTKAVNAHSKKLYNVNILFLSFLLILFGSLAILANLSDLINTLFSFGLGFYLTILILILNILAKKKLEASEL